MASIPSAVGAPSAGAPPPCPARAPRAHRSAARPFAEAIAGLAAPVQPPAPRPASGASPPPGPHEPATLRSQPRRCGPSPAERPRGAVVESRRDEAKVDAGDELDCTVRALAAIAPPPAHAAPLTVAPPSPSPAAAGRADEVRALALATLEQAAFWGDGQRGVARLRFGAGAKGGLAGSTVTLEAADGGAVRVVVEGNEGDDVDAEALVARLRAAGIDAG